MKTKITAPLFFFIFLLISNFINSSKAAEIPAIVRDWAAYAGHTDSAFKAPVASDTNYTYVASFTINSGTGADILLVKYDKDGIKQWEKVWTGPGAGRDQATGIVLTNDDIYICGFSYTSSVNDYDMVTLKYKKDGSFVWASTFNGPGSSYDGAAAIALNASGLYVAGVINNTTSSSLDYGLIRYDMSSGTQIWNVSYDYNQLMDIPFALTVSNDSIITITGGSQSSLYDWDYATLNYGPTDTLLSTNRVSGTSAGFDRALAIKSDSNGNVYITGSSAQNSTGYDVKTVKILANGTLDWMKTQDGDGADDEGTDLIVDADENVYVCGTIGFNGQKDIMVLKYDKHGVQQWSQYIDYSTGDDFGVKMCLDQYGNIIVTGSVKTNVYDIYTAGFKPEDGAKVWEDVYDAPYHGLDKAFDITSDANGYIYVTGTAEADTGFGTVTIKYRTDYYTEPGQIDTPAVSYLFYPNSGQIIDTDDKTNTVDYYTLHHYPQLYFNPGEMNMVWAHIDQDTATADTMQRVDVSFLGSSNPTKAFPLKEREDAGYLNYFLGHCPNGITQVYGNESLLFEGVYSGIDAIYSSNNAGLKLYFVCAAQSDPSNIGLKLEGQDNVQIVNNWGLEVQTVLGTYEFEKPRVYQLDGSGNRITLPWTLSWTMNASDEAKFTGWGNYDRDKTLVIEISRTLNLLPINPFDNLDWSTFVGGNYDDLFNDSYVDANNSVLSCGTTTSYNFPTVLGITVYQDQHSTAGGRNAIIIKSNSIGINLWVTYFGTGKGEEGRGICTDSQNNVYIVGYTSSYDEINTVDFGGDSYIQDHAASTGPPGSIQTGYILELSNDGIVPLWLSYFGGSNIDFLEKIKIDALDNLFVVGTTRSYDFPSENSSGSYTQFCAVKAELTCSLVNNSDIITTSNTTGLQIGDFVNGSGIPAGTTITQIISSTSFSISNNVTSPSDDYPVFFSDNLSGSIPDGFLSKFNSLHELKWSTCYGGSYIDGITDIVVDNSGNAFITGITRSQDFPTKNLGSVYFDGSLDGLSDAFIAKFNNNGIQLYSSFYGGNGDERGTSGYWYGLPIFNWGILGPSINIDNQGNTFLCGTTSSTDNTMATNQTTNSGGSDLWIAKFNNSLNRTWGTYFGGPGEEYANDISFDPYGNFYIIGSAYYVTSIPFPPVPTGYYISASNGEYDNFILKFNSNCINTWGTFFGGADNDFAVSSVYVDAPKQIRIYGATQSQDYYRENYWGNLQYFQYNYGGPLSDGFDGSISRFMVSTNWIGIEDLELNDFNVQVYPNPSSNIIGIKFKIKSEIDSEIFLSVYNVLGEIVLSKTISEIHKENYISLDISKFSSGMYTIDLYTKTGSSHVQFIKTED